MTIWALSDLHLSISNPDKDMSVFGQTWEDYIQKMQKAWDEKVSDDDLVLIAGDISWAMKPDEVKEDLQWIHERPGKKVMIKGNHDYWWASKKKVLNLLPKSIHIIQNDAFHQGSVSIAGTRLWDCPDFNFNQLIDYIPNENENVNKNNPLDHKKLYERELQRLKLSLDSLKQDAKTKIVMTHYPPISADLTPSKVSILLEQYGVDLVIFGHLHNLKKNSSLFGKLNGIEYILTAADYLNFNPIKIN